MRRFWMLMCLVAPATETTVRKTLAKHNKKDAVI